MKQGNNMRRGRGRGQRKPHGMGGQHSGGMNKGNQTYDSNGPDIRVRGNAHQVLEKYLQMARDAGVAGDRVAAENYLQHAEHYYRTIAAQTEGQRPRVGGRELSVADVNVQNVSQGLPAALYTASAEGLAEAGDASPSGNFAGSGGERDQFNGYHGQGGRHSGMRDHGSRDQRDHAAADEHNDVRDNDARNGEGRGEGRGQRRFQRGPGRDGQQRHDGGYRQIGERQDYRSDGNPRGDRYNEARRDHNRRDDHGQMASPMRRNADRAVSEQPDYPSELLPQTLVSQPAVIPPETQPSLTQPISHGSDAGSVTERDGATSAKEIEAAPVRRGRGRPRGPASGPRRISGGEASAEDESSAASIDAGE